MASNELAIEIVMESNEKLTMQVLHNRLKIFKNSIIFIYSLLCLFFLCTFLDDLFKLREIFKSYYLYHRHIVNIIPDNVQYTVHASPGNISRMYSCLKIPKQLSVSRNPTLIFEVLNSGYLKTKPYRFQV